MLTIDGLVKTYDGERARRVRATAGARVHAVDGVSFEVTEGELFTLLGPSGCGKTTTLRSVAGLERPDSGRITLADRVLFDAAAKVNVPASRRDLGMVFQSYAIWPHMTVFKNVSFPLDVLPRGRRPRRHQLEERVGRVLELTELAAFAHRPATKLSGGQQQRLALARALVTQPVLMLLDEPLSNLDAKLREGMRFELKRLQRELGLTAIYVTHDQSEALVMSSRIAVMNEGRIEQVGKPREVYTKPTSRFVAEFVGTSNFIPSTVVSAQGGEVTVDTVEGRLTIHGAAPAPVAGTEVLVSIRPECIDLSADLSTHLGGDRPGPGANRLAGVVANRAFMGDSVDHVVSVGKLELRTRTNPTVSIPPGTDVHLAVDPAKIMLVPLD